ncbi:MAG: exopolysaccharide Pel transporter PelG [Kiritimatiellia bacterium]
MAGIGFELRKLLHRDDLSGIVAGMTRATVLSTGPWIFTVLSLAGIDTLGPQLVARTELTEFQLVIFYNFAFSLVVSGPILTVVTRYLSDLVYGRRTREGHGAAGGFPRPPAGRAMPRGRGFVLLLRPLVPDDGPLRRNRLFPHHRDAGCSRCS